MERMYNFMDAVCGYYHSLLFSSVIDLRRSRDVIHVVPDPNEFQKVKIMMASLIILENKKRIQKVKRGNPDIRRR